MDYTKIPDYPKNVTAGTVLARLMDGLLFRYYWATEGLTESDLKFKPSDSSMDMMELLKHLHHMAHLVNQSLDRRKSIKQDLPNSFDVIRQATLDLYKQSRTTLLTISETDLSECVIGAKEFPFWHLINGPIADALTHVGQIASWRRTAGNPIPKHNPFLGKA